MADNPQTEVEVADNSSPTLATSALQSTLNTQVGIVTETAPASDTASSGLNGRLQRIAQRLTSIFTTQTDGTQQTKIRGNTDGTLIGNIGDALKVLNPQSATFCAFVTASAIAANKSMISLVNTSGSTVKVKLREIWIVNAQTTGITGIIANFQLNRMTGHSAGTLVTPASHDSTDSLNASVTVRTGATISGTETTLKRWQFSSDEWGSGPQDVESMDHIMQSVLPLYKDEGLWKPITLNANEGVHIKQTIASTAGSFDLKFVFTQELA